MENKEIIICPICSEEVFDLEEHMAEVHLGESVVEPVKGQENSEKNT